MQQTGKLKVSIKNNQNSVKIPSGILKQIYSIKADFTTGGRKFFSEPRIYCDE